MARSHLNIKSLFRVIHGDEGVSGHQPEAEKPVPKEVEAGAGSTATDSDQDHDPKVELHLLVEDPICDPTPEGGESNREGNGNDESPQSTIFDVLSFQGGAEVLCGAFSSALNKGRFR